MAPTKAQLKKLKLREKWKAAKAATAPTPAPTPPPRPVENKNAGEAVAGEAEAVENAGAVKHNNKCEACGMGGLLVCCSTCNLVFHPNKCGLPLHRVPSGDWSCWFCLLDGVIPSTPEAKKQQKGWLNSSTT